VNLEGENQKAILTEGQFDSMPPNSAVVGKLIFDGSPTTNTIILQVGYGENLKFYEFNFIKRTYKETVIG